ncbi:MAG: hypothetical protein ABIS03_14910 [Gemmatimonadaceae bacterium]
MTSHRVQAFFLCVSTVIVASCGRGDKSASADSAVSAPLPALVPSGSAENPGWRLDEAGPALLLSTSENRSIASVLLPSLTDSSLADATNFRLDSLSGMSVDLFKRSGSAGSARMVARNQATDQASCVSWPRATLEGVGQRAWRVGFRKGLVTPIPLDSLEGATPADSLRITTELARLASILPGANDPAFRGLPFAVRKAYRSHDGLVDLLVGDVVRKINEEANPREEHFLILAERPASTDGEHTTVFNTRSAGSEEMVRTNEILAAVRFVDGGNPGVVVSFEYENGGRIALIERVGPSVWKEIWKSAYSGC